MTLRNLSNRFIIAVCLFNGINGCKKDPPIPGEEIEIMAGGASTIFSSGPDAFTFPLANLDAFGISKHLLADGAFGQHFVSAPAANFGGLGPLFNQNSCESCHIRNGRGTVPQYEGDLSSGLLLRLSIGGIGPNGGIMPVPGFGGQLQTKAIFGSSAEGKLSKIEIAKIMEYADGLQVTLQKPVYSIVESYIPLPGNTLISPRNAPPVHGLGLLEAIREFDILAQEDEFDADGDGISGKANWVWNRITQNQALGRFGWKAEQATAFLQAADAAHNDMGLTQTQYPLESCMGQSNCVSGIQSAQDVDDETIALFAFYFQTLAVPAPRNTSSAQVIKGKKIFTIAQCNKCHSPNYVTGSHQITALSNQNIYPYTDLLLHDMGEDLSDNRPSFSAEGNEWRTPPLWGIGLTQVVNPKATFLHDGRAKTIEEAILWHGGEAEASKEYVRKLSKEDRAALLAFIQAL